MIPATKTFIGGIGVYLPPTVTVEEAVAQGLYDAENPRLHELAGAAVAGDIPAPEMALRAAKIALERSGARGAELDLMIYSDVWHQGPDGWQPQYYLQRHLVGGAALAVEIRHGCNGMFSALELASAYLHSIASSASRRSSALLVAADNFSTPLVNRWQMDPAYIAGDAAAAVILTTEPSFAQLLCVRSSSVPEAEEMHRGDEPLFPPGVTIGQALDFTSRNAEFRKRLSVDVGQGSDVLFRVHQRTLGTVYEALGEAGLELGDIARVAYMNYSREIVENRCMAALGLPMSMSTWNFGRTVGHLGAGDQIVSLERMVTMGVLAAGDSVLMLGVGPGITVSCAIVKVLACAPWCSKKRGGENDRRNHST